MLKKRKKKDYEHKNIYNLTARSKRYSYQSIHERTRLQKWIWWYWLNQFSYCSFRWNKACRNLSFLQRKQSLYDWKSFRIKGISKSTYWKLTTKKCRKRNQKNKRRRNCGARTSSCQLILRETRLYSVWSNRRWWRSST